MSDDTPLHGTEGSEDRNFVTALARGLDVLRCFRPNETTLTNQDIAARTGLPKPTVTRLTYTLCKLGYLNHSERTGTYRLGAGVLALGFGVLSGIEIADQAAEHLKALSAGPNLHVTSAIAERHGLHMLCMAVRRPGQAVNLTLHVGARLPLFNSAAGRAVLAVMPEDERGALIARAAAGDPGEADRIRASAARAVSDHAAHGYCTSFGAWSPDINGIAVPVVSLGGDRVYGLTAGGPSFLVPEEVLTTDYAPRLKAAAKALSRAAG